MTNDFGQAEPLSQQKSLMNHHSDTKMNHHSNTEMNHHSDTDFVPNGTRLDELKQLNNDLQEEVVVVQMDEPSPGGNGEWKEEVEVAYRVDETPPFGLCILLAFQVLFFTSHHLV